MKTAKVNGIRFFFEEVKFKSKFTGLTTRVSSMLQRLKSLHPEEWLLASMLVLGCVLFPFELGRALKTYQNLIFGVGVLGLCLLSWRKGRLHFPSDIFSWALLGFITLQFLSYFWAVHPSLIWHKAINWLTLFAFYLYMRSIDLSSFSILFWKNIALIIAFANIGLILWFYFQVGSFEGGVFLISSSGIQFPQKFFAQNTNSIACLFLLGVPLLLSLKDSNRFDLILLAVTCFLALILLFNSRSAILAIGLMALIYLIKQGSTRQMLSIILPALAAIIIAGLFIGLLLDHPQKYLAKYNPLRSLKEHTTDERLVMWEKSGLLLSEHPIGGVGNGNWSIEYLRDGLEDFPHYKNYIHAHNYLIETTTELGPLGGVTLLFLLFFPFWYSLKSPPQNRKELLLLLLMLAYLVISLFLGIAYNPNGHFSILLVLWIGSIGLYLNLKKAPSKRLPLPALICLLPIIGIIWSQFILSKSWQYQKMRQYNRTKKYELAIEEAKKLHQPVFHELYSTQVKRPKHTRQLLASSYLLANDSYQAKVNMEAVVKSYPYDQENWFILGNIYKHRKEYYRAIQSYQKALSIDKEHYPSAINLGKSALLMGNQSDFDLAMSYYNEGLNPFIQEVYRSDYLESDIPKLFHFWRKTIDYQNEFLLLEQEGRNAFNQDGPGRK